MYSSKHTITGMCLRHQKVIMGDPKELSEVSEKMFLYSIQFYLHILLDFRYP